MNGESAEEIVVLDQQERCSYLADHTARMPLRRPLGPLTREQLDERLADGDRRSGLYLYRPKCPACDSCEALRVDVARFLPSRTQRRIERRGNPLFEVIIGPPQVDEHRVHLFNAHREQRGLATADHRIDEAGYVAFLTESCCETLEMTYLLQGQLAAVAIVDRGRLAMSAVYCYYDVAFSRYSPGVFSVLTQIRLCREWKIKYLYLGYYIQQSPHMSYKAGYLAHERRVAGQWQRFEKDEG
ncbi:MAG: arginyltransferase [Pirellulaceae bacterium]